MVSPDIFLIGAAKAGTTTIANWMGENPNIALSKIKEPNYFSTDIEVNNFSSEFNAISPSLPESYWLKEELEIVHQDFVKDQNRYDRLFEHAIPGQKLAECSTSYFWSTNAAEEVKRASPKGKISIILRNPVDRAWSHYRMARKYGLVSGSFLEELEKDSSAKSLWGQSHNFYHLSLYSKSLKRWMQHYDADQLRVDIYEVFFENPQNSWNDICQFWGVTDNPVFGEIKNHESQDPQSPILNRLILRLKLKRLTDFLPRRLYVFLKNSLFRKDSEQLSYENRKKAMKYFTDDIRELEPLVGRSLSLWT
jgi:hypothetical protein